MADPNAETEIIVGYELFDTTVPTGTLSTSVSQVNAAYNLAATKFVKKWLAFHDRGIKTALKDMATKLGESSIDKLSTATNTVIDIGKKSSMAELKGAIILRPVGVLDTTAISQMALPGGNAFVGGGTNSAAYLERIKYDADRFSYYNGLSTEADPRDTKLLITNALTGFPVRSHTGLEGNKGTRTPTGDAGKNEMIPNSGGTELRGFATIFSLVHGNLYPISDPVDNPVNQGLRERNLWDEVIVYNNWARDLPPRVTLKDKYSDRFKRDATMFEAMRLDLLKDEFRDLLAAFESNDLALDFDAMPFPFEERLNIMNETMVKAKLSAFSWWVTRCLFDVSEPGSAPKYENVASKEIWSKSHDSTDLVEMEDFDHIDFKSSSILRNRGASNKEGYDGATIRKFEELINGKLEAKATNGVYFSAFDSSEEIKSKKQLRPEVFPYSLPFIDLSFGNNFVWGSTITPFLLSVIAVASALSKKIYEYDGQDSIPIRSWYVSSAAKKIGAPNAGVDDSVKYTETKKVTIGGLADIISENFKGFHFSNRKALNNGVYSVLFMNPSPTHDSIKYEYGDKEVQLLVDVNGRKPIDISKVSKNSTDPDATTPPLKKSILAWVYYYIHGFSFPHLETGRKMTGLIEPYCVLIKGPTDSSLATEMQCGDFYYATAIMIALESEACQLLGHIARDNKKRRRDQSFVVADYFATTRSSNFKELSDKFESETKFKHNDFSAALVRLVRAIKSFNDCLNDAGKTTRDRVVMGRIDGERMIAAQEVLYGNWAS